MVLGGYYSTFSYHLTVLYLYYSSTVHKYCICYYIDIIVPKFQLPVSKLDHLLYNR